MNYPFIYILLPVHNRSELTSKVLQCIGKQTYSNYKLIVLNDGSTDDTIVVVKRIMPNAVIINGKGNWWWAGSLQVGFNWLKRNSIENDDVILILNDDTVFNADYLANAVSFLSSHANTLLLSRAYYSDRNEVWDDGTYLNWGKFIFSNDIKPGQANCFSTRGLFLKWCDVLKIGNMHPRLLPHYGSDYEYTYRAFRKGFKLTTVPGVEIKMTQEPSAVNQMQNSSRWKYIKFRLSKKCNKNPYYFTNFILIACPLKYKLINIIRIWWRFLKEVINH